MNSKNTQKPSNVFLILACWAFPMTWVASIPRDGQPANAPFLTAGLLKHGEATIKAFVKEFASAPRNLCELKAYAAVTNSGFTGWDGFGQRFDYLRLNRTRWYLRSFGSDARQNTLLSKQDPLASSIEDYQSVGITHGYSEKATRFNPAIRLGAFSPQGNWHAEIFTDQISGASRLLVRNRDKHGYFMITDQNTVEEFYWLPDGYRIVFTSTDSNRYRDGIYLWNLLSDEVINIFPGSPKLGIHNAENQQQKWHLSLAGAVKNPPMVLAFVSPRTGNSLNLEKFYTQENFLGLEIPENGNVSIRRGSDVAHLYANPLSSDWSTQSDILNCAAMKSAENTWCQLKLAGTFQSILTSWQEFTEKSSDTAIFSYALFQLIGLYGDSYALLNEYAVEHKSDQDAKRNAEIIRSYGTELAHALSALPVAPTWLRAAAGNARDLFNSKRTLPYQVSRVSIQRDDDLPFFRGQ